MYIYSKPHICHRTMPQSKPTFLKIKGSNCRGLPSPETSKISSLIIDIFI